MRSMAVTLAAHTNFGRLWTFLILILKNLAKRMSERKFLRRYFAR
jgi:hypothetical protein